MASQHGSRYSVPIGNQNFSPNVFNANPGMDRLPAPQFQRPPNAPNGSFQSSESFVHGFQNRPQFSNFAGACGFLNRPPPLPPSSTAHPPPLSACNIFSSPPNSHSPFPGPSNPPPFPGNTNPSPFPGNTNPSPFPGNMNPAPFSGSTNPPPFPVSSNPPPFPISSNPPPFPVSSNLPPFSNAPNCPSPFLSSSAPFPPQSHNPSSTFSTCTSLPPPISPISHPSRPPFSSQRPFSPHQPPPLHNQHQNVLQQNQFTSASHHPNQQQRFHLNSPSPAPRPRFENSFQRPYRPWNQTTRFSGPRTPFSNRSPNIVKSNQFKGISQQGNKKKKEKSREFRKLKDDSTEKPYFCDTCDRAFVTENELSDHFSQHIKCDYETCTFEAHPKIVLLHKKMQHETGYAERISKLKDDAEEVRKWREERRKRFPTAENIKKRQAEQAEREARGEVLETKEFGKFKRRSEGSGSLANNDGSNNRRRMRGYRGGHRGKRNHFRRNFHEPDYQRFKVNSESDSDSDSHISLNMFSGLSCLSNSPEGEMCHLSETVERSSSGQYLQKSILSIDENHLNQSHSEINLIDRKIESPILSDVDKSRGKKRTANESILEIPEDEIMKPKRQLISIEDSDDEGGPEVIAISKCPEEVNQSRKRTADESILEIPEDEIVKPKKQLIVIEDSDGESPEVTTTSKCEEEINIREKEKKIVSDVNDESKVPENCQDDTKSNQPRSHKTRRENNFSAKQYAPNKIRKSSLLEKLLADDIRHERNVILQCIRHIVNNNFFGLAVKK